MKEVSHSKEGGFGATDVAFGLITGGIGFLCPSRDEVHEVVVEHDGEYGVGSGETHAEARQNAIRDLND